MTPLRFASRYYRPLGGRLAFSSVAAASLSLLVLPVLYLIRQAFDVSIPAGDIRGLIWIGAGIIAIRGIGGGLGLLLRSFMVRTTRGAVANLRADLLGRLYVLSRRYFSRADFANLHTRIVQDTERIEGVSQKLLSTTLPTLLTVPVLVAALLYLDWRLTCLGLLLIPLLWLATRLTNKRVKDEVSRHQRAFEGFSKSVLFAINHIDLTRARGYEMEEVSRQRAIIGDVNTTGHRMAMAFAAHGQVQRTLMNLAGICLLVGGGISVAAGGMTVGGLLAFYVAAGQLGGAATTLFGSIPDVLAASLYFSTLQEIMTRGEAAPYTGTKHPHTGRGIDFEKVAFAYEGEPVLRDINLSLRPGTNVAIIGPNGAGKTTLLHLLLGFYRPDAGSVTVGGVPYDDVDVAELRRGFGLVPQNPAFFYGSVRENVAYGLPDATDEQVRSACRRARAEAFIERLPDGYDTVIGERGFRLSGGERQRLAIARALLGQPRVLVLDEPTNHLDVMTVGDLMRDLMTGNDRPMVVTISHDPEVVQLADTVFFLQGGKLVAQPVDSRTAAMPAGIPG